jgi:hypothetical protein
MGVDVEVPGLLPEPAPPERGRLEYEVGREVEAPVEGPDPVAGGDPLPLLVDGGASPVHEVAGRSCGEAPGDRAEGVRLIEVVGVEPREDLARRAGQALVDRV